MTHHMVDGQTLVGTSLDGPAGGGGLAKPSDEHGRRGSRESIRLLPARLGQGTGPRDSRANSVMVHMTTIELEMPPLTASVGGRMGLGN